VALAEGDRGALPGVARTSGTRQGKLGPRRQQLGVDVRRGGGDARLRGGVMGKRHRRGGAHQRMGLDGQVDVWRHGLSSTGLR
jgi:hypothetical protein